MSPKNDRIADVLAARIKNEGLEWRYAPAIGYRVTEGDRVFGLRITYRKPGAPRWTKGFHVWAHKGETASELLAPLEQLLGPKGYEA